jgi:hypothetical protein
VTETELADESAQHDRRLAHTARVGFQCDRLPTVLIAFLLRLGGTQSRKALNEGPPQLAVNRSAPTSGARDR